VYLVCLLSAIIIIVPYNDVDVDVDVQDVDYQ